MTASIFTTGTIPDVAGIVVGRCISPGIVGISVETLSGTLPPIVTRDCITDCIAGCIAGCIGGTIACIPIEGG